MTPGDEPDDLEILGDDMEIRDQPREAEEEELDIHSSTGEVFEAFTDPDDGEPIEVSQGDTEPARDPNTW